MKDSIKKLKLSDLVPTEAEFQIADGTTLKLRAATLRDFEWMENTLKEKKISDLRRTCVVVFRLLKDKEKFQPVQVEDYDDDGNKITTTITGPELLMDKISGATDYKQMMLAMNKSIGTEEVAKDEIEKIEADLKKKKNQTGAKSLKSSP